MLKKAMNLLNMEKESEKFYKIFCKKTQNKDGSWEQRYYTDGRLAPSWGYQIDETASVVYGVYKHFEFTKQEKFLKENLVMCEKAISFLKKYLKDWLNIEGIDEHDKDIVQKEIEENMAKKGHKIHVSYDLWEENEGIHLYSLASIYSAFECMIKIYMYLGIGLVNYSKEVVYVALTNEEVETKWNTSMKQPKIIISHFTFLRKEKCN